ncbi:hypothetical protein D3C86_1469200 [compost metagenome]
MPRVFFLQSSRFSWSLRLSTVVSLRLRPAPTLTSRPLTSAAARIKSLPLCKLTSPWLLCTPARTTPRLSGTASPLMTRSPAERIRTPSRPATCTGPIRTPAPSAVLIMLMRPACMAPNRRASMRPSPLSPLGSTYRTCPLAKSTELRPTVRFKSSRAPILPSLSIRGAIRLIEPSLF